MSETPLGELLVGVWRQVLAEGRVAVELPDGTHPVTRTRSQGLRIVHFQHRNRDIEGIEQNPLKTSTWAKRASQGERIIQFKAQGRYIGNVAEGKLTRYPAWKSLGLPD